MFAKIKTKGQRDRRSQQTKPSKLLGNEGAWECDRENENYLIKSRKWTSETRFTKGSYDEKFTYNET